MLRTYLSSMISRISIETQTIMYICMISSLTIAAKLPRVCHMIALYDPISYYDIRVTA